jgi:phosphoinositide-3-kinase regulatory subunit 4
MKFHFEFTHSNRNQNTASLGSRTGFNAPTTQGGSNNAIVQQQYLMRNHTDAITDIILTEIPYPMIVSGDRDGVIKIVS